MIKNQGNGGPEFRRKKNPNSFQIDKGYPKWWMDENFHPDYIEMTKFRDQFLPVPVGDSNEQEAPVELLTDIKIAFPHKQRSTCLFSSTASALAYCKRKPEATSLIRRSNKVENLDLSSQIKEIRNFMESYIPSVGVCKVYGVRTGRHKRVELTLQDLCENITPYVTIVIPQMTNGSQNHAFCVVDDLIFDSTQVKALKLQESSVEWICQPNNGFRKIHSAF